ncbi:MAG TPA: hypothetical protein VHN98_00660 [Acidimicrobiales bacterium]|nr:hypothetical protein [Acidimicrobiales bacterium]
MLDAPRLRQVALVARTLQPAADELRSELALPPPFHDPGVDAFGLENAVFAVGDTFLEIVAPVREGTTAGRYLERRGGDSGYMAIFQVPDLEGARARISALGIRVVWQADLADIAGTHLHPKDVPGAIVSIDWADPPESWRWAGPSWRGGAPADRTPGGITGLVVEVTDPAGAAATWAGILGVEVTQAHGRPAVVLDGGRQTIVFRDADGAEGIAEISVDLPDEACRGRQAMSACGVTIRFPAVDDEEGEGA